MERSAPFFRAGGTMDPTAPSYIARESDAKLLEALIRGDYVFLLDSRQKGKSSLVARTILRLADQGVGAVKLDLQSIGANVTADQWYAGLLAAIAQELCLQDELFSYWKAHQDVGPLARWVGALTAIVLPKADRPLVIFIDEVDFVRALPFSVDEFFAAIRECFNRRSTNRLFQRVTFCLIGVATPSQLIGSPDMTPFNIGVRIDLRDFRRDELRSYGDVLSANRRDGAALVDRVHWWLSGHPYLTQLVCQEIFASPDIRNAASVDKLIHSLFFTPEARQREPNLADVERRLLLADVPGLAADECRAQILSVYGRMLRRRAIEAREENPIIATLRLSGISSEVGGQLRLRNAVYARVFDESWRVQNLPDAESRRQKQAIRKATLRTSAVAGAVLVAVSAGALKVLQLSNDRQRALDDLARQAVALNKTSQDRATAIAKLEANSRELRRVSDERGKVLDSLSLKNKELDRVSKERESAITRLEARTGELSVQSYREQVSLINAEILLGRWGRVAEAVDRSATSPHRQWEWGLAAKAVSFGGRRDRFPKWSAIEPQPSGMPYVATREALYDTNTEPPRLIMRFDQSRPFMPNYAKGNLRVQQVESNRGDVLRDAATQRLLTTNRPYSMVFDIDLKRRRYLLGVGTTLNMVQLRTVDGDRLIVGYVAPKDTDTATFLPDGSVLSLHPTDVEGVGEIRHWDSKGNTLDVAKTNQWYAKGLALTREGAKYAAWGYDEQVQIRTVKGHAKVVDLPPHPKKVTSLEFSRDGTEVLTGSDDGIVRVFDAKTGALKCRFLGHAFPVERAVFVEDGRTIASIDSSGEYRLWDRKQAPYYEELPTHPAFVQWKAMDSRGSYLVSAATNGSLACRDMRTDALTMRSLDKQMPAVARNDESVFWGRPDGAIERVSLPSLKGQGSTKVFEEGFAQVTSIDRGRRLFVAHKEKRQYAILDAKSLRVVGRIEPKLDFKPLDENGIDINANFAFDEVRNQIAIYLGETREIQIYASDSGRLLKRWKPGRVVIAMCFVDRGTKLVASLGAAWFVRDGKTVVYNAANGKRVAELQHSGRTVGEFAYSEKTRILAGVTHDRTETARIGLLWKIDGWQKCGELVTGDGMWTPSFSPDGERLVTNSLEDGTIHLWNARTGDECLSLKHSGLASTGWAARALFSDDGMHLLAGTTSGRVRVFTALPWH